ncbi:hypothetical protein LZC95_36115 [Pendulispora brunnea]|uniref:Lipoprotein n=1 Tax=Pendulispora brunnea TaxID=2905690 RepID=A0ABZ2K411_9BACT
MVRSLPLVGLVAVFFALGSVGCSSVGSSAVRTGPLNLPARSGPVAIYTTSPPPGGRDLGFVEVHAVGEDGVIENLLPTFARRVAELGGNAALIERVNARFQVVNYWQTGMYTYNCWPSRYRCYGTGAYPASHEVMIVTMTGRALTAGNPAPSQGETP